MNQIDTLFNRMDDWRHFPNYQLERRADLFFSLYLPEVLEAKFGFPMRAQLTPEFPVRIGTIYKIPTDKSYKDRSYKIDYLALSAKADKAVFVELKTDGNSRRPKQDHYLEAARGIGLSCLLDGLLKIFRATDSKRKYFRLLQHLESMGLLSIPIPMNEVMAKPSLQGADEASKDIKVVAQVDECLIVYIQPNGTKPNVISFSEFAEIVRRHDDPVSERFARSLCKWAERQAGETAPSC